MLPNQLKSISLITTSQPHFYGSRVPLENHPETLPVGVWHLVLAPFGVYVGIVALLYRGYLWVSAGYRESARWRGLYWGFARVGDNRHQIWDLPWVFHEHLSLNFLLLLLHFTSLLSSLKRFPCNVIFDYLAATTYDRKLFFHCYESHLHPFHPPLLLPYKLPFRLHLGQHPIRSSKRLHTGRHTAISSIFLIRIHSSMLLPTTTLPLPTAQSPSIKL